MSANERQFEPQTAAQKKALARFVAASKAFAASEMENVLGNLDDDELGKQEAQVNAAIEECQREGISVAAAIDYYRSERKREFQKGNFPRLDPGIIADQESRSEMGGRPARR